MSAAEHATPERRHVSVNIGRPAPVIDLDGRRHGAPRTVRGRWKKTMTTPDGPAGKAHGGEERGALEEWAESIEKSFLETRLSLTHPETATAFLRSLDVFERTLQGFHAGGVITDGQLTELTAAIDGMRQVPRLI